MTEQSTQVENSASSQPDGLVDLSGVSELQELFSEDNGRTRLLLLLSPT